MLNRHLVGAAVRKFFTLMLGLLSVCSWAQSFPVKPVRIIVPFPAGGPADIIARHLAERLTAMLGQSFMVDNRGGAGGFIGTEAVAKARADGYTLLVTSSGPVASGLALYGNVAYDAAKDLTAVAVVANATVVLLATPRFPAATVGELIAIARSKPDSVRVALNSVGSIQHLLAELLRARNGTRMVFVPYKGSGPAIVDLVAGQVDIDFESLPGVVQLLQAGRLKALAVASALRSELIPGVPTFRELDMPEFIADPWFAMMAPAATPRPTIDTLSNAVGRILRLPEVKEQFAKQGASPVLMTTEEAGKFIRGEITRWARVVAETGAKLE